MEANGMLGRINVSETVAGHVRTLFELDPRGSVVAKHERAREMFFLNRLKPEFSRDPEGHIPKRISSPNATACSPVSPARSLLSRHGQRDCPVVASSID
jgi:hypothetical protein